MSFLFLATLASIAALILGLGWLFFGHLMLRRWGCEVHPSALIVGRRIGAIYFVTAIVFGVVRNATAPELIAILSLFGTLVNVMLCGLGIMEMVQRRVGKTMLISIVVEIFLAIGFGRLVLISPLV